MSFPNRVFLIGPMGSGKTTIGRQLARSLNKDFIDSDREIEALTGATVALIFDVEGEAGFRRRERKVIDELTQRDNLVLATGGGVILDPDNRAALRERGTVVYLSAPLHRLYDRVRMDKSRPLLDDADPRARLAAIVEQRTALYEETADIVMETNTSSVRQVVKELRQRLQT